MKQFAQGQPTGICIHHSLTKDSKSLSLAAIEKYHVDTNGWEAIGYHVVVEMVGEEARVMSARSSAYQGAHEPKLNATHLGLCIVGNFDQDVPNKALFDAAVRGCVALMVIHPRIRLLDIAFHNDYSTKSCPGDMFPKTAFLLAVDEKLHELGIRR